MGNGYTNLKAFSYPHRSILGAWPTFILSLMGIGACTAIVEQVQYDSYSNYLQHIVVALCMCYLFNPYNVKFIVCSLETC